MDEGKDKGINPVEPLGADEPEPTPAGGVTGYPGYKKRGLTVLPGGEQSDPHLHHPSRSSFGTMIIPPPLFIKKSHKPDGAA